MVRPSTSSDGEIALGRQRGPCSRGHTRPPRRSRAQWMGGDAPQDSHTQAAMPVGVLVYIPIGMNAGLELPHPGGNASGGFWNACPSRVLCSGPKWRVDGCALVSTVPVALRALFSFEVCEGLAKQVLKTLFSEVILQHSHCADL